MKLHRELIRKDGNGGRGRAQAMGSVFWFRTAVSATISGAQVQTNILQVHKVHTYFLALSKEHLSVDNSTDAHAHKSGSPRDVA